MKKQNIVLKLKIIFLLLVNVHIVFAQLNVFTIGDSTVQDYNEGYSPRKGWGQMLQAFFLTSGVTVKNKGAGGTSSMSYYKNQWPAVRDNLKVGDYIFIQFGINDRNTDPLRYAPAPTVFKEYIRKYVAEARAKGAIPILVTTVRRNAWANGLPYDSYHDHPVAMRELATELKTPLVDLDARCRDLMVTQGQLYYTRHVTMNLVAGEYPNYKNGNADDVHYQQTGATDMARYVCDAVKASTVADMKKLATFLKPQYTVTVNINDKSKAQTITRTTTYPEGIAMTMKTIPATGAKFLRWENAAGQQVSTSPIYLFKMGAAETSYTAIYESNAVTLPTQISIDNASKTISVSGATRYQWYFNNTLLVGATAAKLSVTNNGTYSVKLLDANGKVLKHLSICVDIATDGTIRRIFIIGDSTVCDYKDSQYPWAGWGQVLKYFFNQDIQIINNAIGGRSSRSFRKEGRWKTIEAQLKPGDYVFIQFGHNDRDTKPERYTSVNDYKMVIDSFVVETRAKGAIPVLVTPMVMNAWNGTTLRNVFTEKGNDYRGAMAEVAASQKVPFVDLNMKSFNFFKTLNANFCSRFYYHTYAKGEYPNFPDGSTDGTHFQENGAVSMARWIVEGLTESNDPFICPLTRYMKPQYTVTVNSDIANPGEISKTATFPEGCPVTVKVLPSSGNTLIRWNQNNKQVSTSTLYHFTMGPTNTTLSAIFNTSPQAKDCAGVLNGTAYLDDCNTCVGGTTGKISCATFETEKACEFVGVLETIHLGYKGEGYVNTDNAIGATIKIGITSTAAQSVDLHIRYANGGAKDRPGSVSLNGVVAPNAIVFPATGAWTTWVTIPVALALKTGYNEVVFSSTTADGMPNIDLFGYTSSGIIFNDCTNEVAMSVMLKVGWNMIGCPIEGNTDIDKALSSIWNNVESVKDYDGFYNVSNPPALNSLTKLNYGKGYMIKVAKACELTWKVK